MVLDIETLWETGNSLPDAVEAELAAAIEQVRSSGQPVRLRPQSRRIRLFEHRAIEAAGLASESSGSDPDRAVEVRPGSGTPPEGPTVISHEGRHRAIEIALVECERGRVAGATWHRLVNPGVPVDPETYKKHGIPTEKLADAPAFPAIAPELLERLLPASAESVVLVAHNAPFDVGVLRTEFELLGHDLPDVAVIDTEGPLAAAVGVKPRDGSLEGLLVALGITNAAPHRAGGDAAATAAAALELLRRASERGIASVAELLEVAGGRHTGAMRHRPGRIRPSRILAPRVPTEHLEEHLSLGRHPSKSELAAWIAMADGCARRCCPGLGYSYDSLVRTSDAEPETLLAALVEVVRLRAAAGDGPGANTALGAIEAAYVRFCPMPAPDHSGFYALRRKPTIALYHRLVALVQDLPACTIFGRCPACAEGDPCSRHELARALAPAVLDPRWEDGKMTRGSTIMSWVRPDEAGGWFYHRQDPAMTRPDLRAGMAAGPALADAATALFLRFYGSDGEEADGPTRVAEILARVVARGCTDPAVIEMWVERQALGGRPEDLEAAIRTANAVLALRPTPAEAAWSSLEMARDLLTGRLRRMIERKRITRDGVVEPIRIHRPGPRARRRALRFVPS